MVAWGRAQSSMFWALYISISQGGWGLTSGGAGGGRVCVWMGGQGCRGWVVVYSFYFMILHFYLKLLGYIYIYICIYKEFFKIFQLLHFMWLFLLLFVVFVCGGGASLDTERYIYIYIYIYTHIHIYIYIYNYVGVPVPWATQSAQRALPLLHLPAPATFHAAKRTFFATKHAPVASL